MSQQNDNPADEHYEGAYIKNPPFTRNYADRFLVFEKGKGTWLWDREGKKYLDLASGIAVNSFGHGRSDFARIISRQMKTLAHTSNLYTTEATLEFARRLVLSSPLATDQPWNKDRHPGYFGGVHLGNSGSEANETALKYARIYGKRKENPNGFKILAFQNSFHGRTMGALSCTWTAKYREPSEPLVPGVTFLPFNDVQALRDTLSREFCAVIVEPIQGEGGLMPMTADFARELNTLCRKLDVVLIADEIQCGMGRTGTLFASEALGLEPDIITLAKPLAGGLPASATLVRPRINDIIHPGDHGSTFGGNPVAAALGSAVWDLVTQPDFLAEVQATGTRFREYLGPLRETWPWIGALRGKGMLIGLEINKPAHPHLPADGDDMVRLIGCMLDAGVIVLRSGQNVLRLAPVLQLSAKDLQEAYARLAAGFEAFAKI